MRKLILILIIIIIFPLNLYAAAGDISTGVTESKPSVVKWRLKSVFFHVPAEMCEVVYNKLAADDSVIERSASIYFKNIPDNPSTPQDETSTEFTDLITAINNGNNIRNTITNAVKIKLGI